MDNEIKIVVDIKDTLDRQKEKFSIISNDEKHYTSQEQYKAYQNYFKHKEESNLMFGLTEAFIKSGFDTVKQTFIKKVEKIGEREVESIVKEWVKNNPNMTWED